MNFGAGEGRGFTLRSFSSESGMLLRYTRGFGSSWATMVLIVGLGVLGSIRLSESA